MKYINAKSFLPQELVEELQRYIQGGCLYVPAKDEQYRGWGEIFFDFAQMSDAQKIGNLKTDDQREIIRRILEEDIPALNLARDITVKELAERYGDMQSQRVFFLDDYKSYLLNRYLEDIIGG